MTSRSVRMLAAAGAVLTVVAAGCTVDLGRGATQAEPVELRNTTIPATSTGNEPVADVVARVLPSVVNVTSDVVQTDQYGNAQQGQGVGTGFVVRSDGVIVTNCHVVEGATRISVFTSDEEPTRYDARVIGGDCANDLAVLKIDAENLPALELGSSDGLVLGQRVIALGYALALEGGPSVTTGIVSSLDRTIQAQDPQCPPDACADGVRTYSEVIQTDAAINHGNSGGPLVDMAGRVIGINSAGNDAAENIGFAIKIDAAKAVIAEAMDSPLSPSPYLGVQTRTVDSQVAYELGLDLQQGALVLATTEEGPAAAAGIAQGDVIVAIDGREVAGSEDVAAILGDLAPGDEVEVQVVREGGDTATATVTLGSRPLPIELP